jgi:hypothetical protein
MRDTTSVVKRGLCFGVVITALLVAGTAAAAPPSLLSVGQTNRHPTAQFSMPGADDATIYLASKPDRATDGSFLQENIKEYGFLTTAEIQSGAWLDESQIDPGLYYVMARATDYDCIGQPSCIDGYSNMLTLEVPKPHPSYRGSVHVFHYLHEADLTLRVTPLGERLPYKVCWRLKSGRRPCVRGAVSGFSWNSPAEDEVTARLRGMAKRTTFSWYVHGSRVASKTADTRAY